MSGNYRHALVSAQCRARAIRRAEEGGEITVMVPFGHPVPATDFDFASASRVEDALTAVYAVLVNQLALAIRQGADPEDYQLSCRTPRDYGRGFDIAWIQTNGRYVGE